MRKEDKCYGGGGEMWYMNEALDEMIVDCKMVVKEIVGRLLEEEEVNHFGKEKLEWWFEQDIDKEEERFEGDEDGSEV
ncbi:hypothetical protein Tco_1238369 [Tanacetum coccineum]